MVEGLSDRDRINGVLPPTPIDKTASVLNTFTGITIIAGVFLLFVGMYNLSPVPMWAGVLLASAGFLCIPAIFIVRAINQAVKHLMTIPSER